MIALRRRFRRPACAMASEHLPMLPAVDVRVVPLPVRHLARSRNDVRRGKDAKQKAVFGKMYEGGVTLSAQDLRLEAPDRSDESTEPHSHGLGSKVQKKRRQQI